MSVDLPPEKKVTRYHFSSPIEGDAEMYESPDGDYVLSEDYAQIERENAELLSESTGLSLENSELKIAASMRLQSEPVGEQLPIGTEYLLVDDMDEGFDPRYGRVLIATHNSVKVIEQAAAEPKAALWCVHIEGPDDVYPAPNKAEAERAVEFMKQRWKERSLPEEFPHVGFEVIEWPHSADSHVSGIASFYSDTGLPLETGDKND